MGSVVFDQFKKHRFCYFSLPPNKDNPFLTTCPPPVPGSNGSQSELTKKVGGWNPFGDTQSFGAVTEDAIFGNYNIFGVS